MKKSVMIFAVYIIVVITIVILCISTFFNILKPENDHESESLEEDFAQYYDVFQNIVEEFDLNKPITISSTDYDRNNANLKTLFEKMGYRSVNFGYNTVQFDKYGDNLHFMGIVYAVNPSELNIPKANIIKYLDPNNRLSKWCIYEETYI